MSTAGLVLRGGNIQGGVGGGKYMSTLLHSFKWSFIADVGSKLVTPVVFIVLARLLTPQDFGVMTSALMVISFSQIFWEAGMGKAIIQRQTDRELSANFAFCVNIGLAIFIALLLCFFSESVASTIFDDDRVSDVLKVMSVQIVFGALSSVHIALLQKDMGFKKLFWVRFATVSLPGLASIPLALKGMGYWSLVIGTLVGQLAQVIILWQISNWRPRLIFDVAVSKDIGRFGAWAAASGLLTWFYVWVDSLIVGAYFGSSELGRFRIGSQFSTMVFALVFAPITPVLYSHLSKISQSTTDFRNTVLRVLTFSTLVAIPISVLILAYSDEIQEVFFGGEWGGLGLVIGVMAVMHGYSWIVGFNGEVYRAAGKPAYETVVTSATLVIYTTGYLVAIQHSFEAFLWTRMGLALGAVLLHLLILKRVVTISVASVLGYVGRVTVVSWSIVYGVYFSVICYVEAGLLRILLGGIVSVGFLGLFFYLFEAHVVKSVIGKKFERVTIND